MRARRALSRACPRPRDWATPMRSTITKTKGHFLFKDPATSEIYTLSLHDALPISGRYIQLEANPNADPEIRDFLVALRACTEGSLAGSDEAGYSEEKFLQVKRIIERFRSEERRVGEECRSRCWPYP